ncbi:MAG TPA: cache domain-containing protein [Xanthobacteraceae bacterium]|nr:cache domain-containing protein [Xanthobacteraceae bacterium]
MKFKHILGIAALGLSLSATALYGQAGGTAAEAKAMLEKAVAALKANKATALANFVKKDGGFIDRDLYVFCFNTADGIFTAHVNPKLMGTDIRKLNVGGQPLGQQIFDGVKEGVVNTVDYNFPKPGSETPSPKQSFITKVADQGCGVGYYK